MTTTDRWTWDEWEAYVWQFLDDIIWMKCPSCGGKGRTGYELGKWYTEAEVARFTCDKCGGWGVVPERCRAEQWQRSTGLPGIQSMIFGSARCGGT